jgi:hypothetical protein
MLACGSGSQPQLLACTGAPAQQQQQQQQQQGLPNGVLRANVAAPAAATTAAGPAAADPGAMPRQQQQVPADVLPQHQLAHLFPAGMLQPGRQLPLSNVVALLQQAKAAGCSVEDLDACEHMFPDELRRMGSLQELLEGLAGIAARVRRRTQQVCAAMLIICLATSCVILKRVSPCLHKDAHVTKRLHSSSYPACCLC